ncbi:MAG: anthrone oxygenase family protein [Burkholderiales bacterium]
MIEVLAVVTAIMLGLFAGSLLTEALLLVPFFRSLSFADFNRLHHDFGPRLYRYYSPLTIAATVLPIVSAATLWLDHSNGSLYASAAALLALAIVSTYALYFRAANQAFAEKRLGEEALKKELTRWAAVHNFRTTLAIAAFVLATLAAIGVSAAT